MAMCALHLRQARRNARKSRLRSSAAARATSAEYSSLSFGSTTCGMLVVGIAGLSFTAPSAEPQRQAQNPAAIALIVRMRPPVLTQHSGKDRPGLLGGFGDLTGSDTLARHAVGDAVGRFAFGVGALEDRGQRIGNGAHAALRILVAPVEDLRCNADDAAAIDDVVRRVKDAALRQHLAMRIACELVVGAAGDILRFELRHRRIV